MSLQQLYETVIREEEYIMEQRKTFEEELVSEFMNSDMQYCLYCLTPKGDKLHCCEESDFGTFAELPKEDQAILVEEEVEAYKEWSRQ